METKEKCKFYKKDIKRCTALRECYCDKEECSFFKPKGQNDDKRRS